MDTLTLYILRGDTVAAYATAPWWLQHDEQHLIGIDAVSKKYGIDLWALPPSSPARAAIGRCAHP